MLNGWVGGWVCGWVGGLSLTDRGVAVFLDLPEDHVEFLEPEVGAVKG